MNRNIASNLATDTQESRITKIRRNSQINNETTKIDAGSPRRSSISPPVESGEPLIKGGRGSPANKKIQSINQSSFDDKLYPRVGNSNFLDKILNQYEHEKGPVFSNPPTIKATLNQNSIRSKSLKLKHAANKKKKPEQIGLPKPKQAKSNEARECAYRNEPSLDTI